RTARARATARAPTPASLARRAAAASESLHELRHGFSHVVAHLAERALVADQNGQERRGADPLQQERSSLVFEDGAYQLALTELSADPVGRLRETRRERAGHLVGVGREDCRSVARAPRRRTA